MKVVFCSSAIIKNKNGNVSRNNIVNSSGYDADFAKQLKNR